MKCFKCKKEIEQTDKFCPYCGAKQGFDQDIIDRAIKGESEAQAELYNNTYSDVYYTIFAITKDEDLLFDVIQDTYLTAFQKLDQLNNADSFRPWVKRIAHNKTLNALRDRKPSKMTFLVSADTEEVIEIKDDRIENMPEEKMDQKETGRLVKEILDALPEDQRVVIGMYYFEQMSINEIAEELGCSGNTIKSRLNYGRKKIESQVLELEKQGTKLYSLAPITFFLWLLQSLRKQPDEKMFASVKKELQNLGANTQVNSEKVKTEENTASHKEEMKKSSADNSSKKNLNSEKMAKSVTERAPVKESASVTEIGKAATTVGKGISMKILAGVAAVAVVAGTAGYMTIQHKNSDANVAQNAGQTETQVQTEQETVVETQTEIQTEAVTETQVETETEAQTETQTETEKKPETALDHIENLGYTYIGGTSYDVTYHTGYAYQENEPEAGISLDAAPTGVAGALKRDMDGDGKEELLLAVLKPADQVYLNNGKQDAKLYFEVYSGEDDEWTLQGETSEEQAYAVHLTEVIPNIKVVCSGTSIYVKESGNGTFPADPANYGKKYEYNGNGFTALSNSDMGYTDGQISDEIVNAVNNSGAEDLLCEFIVPEIYEQDNRELLYTLYDGTPISVTLELRDNGWVESDSGEPEQTEADQEEESEKIIEIGDASTEAADSKTEFSEEDKALYKAFLTDYYNNTSSNASYLLLDIDQNGTPELFIMDNNQTRGPMGYTEIGIWSIQEHKVVDVGEVYDRARYVRYNQKKLGVVGQTSSAMYVDWALRYFEGNELRVESLYNQYQDPVSYTFGILDRNFTTYYEKRDLTAEEYETIYKEDFNETDIEEMYMIKLTPEEIDNI